MRRHALDGIHRPLIVFTPKSMLRNKAAVSDIKDFTEQKFRSVLEEPTYEDGDRRPRQGDAHPVVQRQAVLRPGGHARPRTSATTSRSSGSSSSTRCRSGGWPRRWTQYPNAKEFFWVQEEPANQGAWPTFGLALPELLPDKLTGIKRISRRAMSAPSSGSSKVHAVEQQEIIDEAFG